jgi:beta-glucanase (GH16 family)
MPGRPKSGGYGYSPQSAADPSTGSIESRPNARVWARYGVIARRTRNVAVVATALLACSTGLAAASQKHAAPRSVTTSVSQTVTTPGTYLVVVTVRARKQPEMVSVYVAGQSPRKLRAHPHAAAQLRYSLNLTTTKLAVRAVSGAPAVHLTMKLTLKKPATTGTTAATTPPAAAPAPPPPAPAPATPPQVANPYTTLKWSDDFSGPAGSPPDPTKWTATGNSGCGGSTPTSNSAANATLDGNGHLVITGNPNGSSAQLDTAGSFSAGPYGSVQASIELPAGAGLCSAFWMVGDGGANPPSQPASCWPKCGEVDILEALGQLPNVAIFTLHGPTNVPAQQSNFQQYEYDQYGLPDLTAGFHTYGVIWTPDSFTWTIDGVAYATETRAALEAANGPAAWTGVYDQAFHIILDLAVGNWQEPANLTAPAKLLVDWVRVYQ